jgi:hypothetical protein
MVWHVVLIAPREPLDLEERRGLLAAFERAVREIPSVRDVRVGRRVTHGAQYEALSPVGFPFLVVIGFDDLSGLQTYLAHPVHQDLAERFYRTVSSAVVHDFEIGGIEELTREIGDDV